MGLRSFKSLDFYLSINMLLQLLLVCDIFIYITLYSNVSLYRQL